MRAQAILGLVITLALALVIVVVGLVRDMANATTAVAAAPEVYAIESEEARERETPTVSTPESPGVLSDADVAGQPATESQGGSTNAFAASTASSTTHLNWYIECVDCPKQFSTITDRNLQLDAEDHPHIAYGGDHLYYAWHDGTKWHYETVDESPRVGSDVSLALDEMGRPHISYIDLYKVALKYAWHDGVYWHIEIVDSYEDVGKYDSFAHTSLALDRLGRPHISYFHHRTGAEFELKHAKYDGVVWQIETVDDVGYAGGYNSLALDGSALPRISYFTQYFEGDRQIRYAWHDGTTWHVEIIANWLGDLRDYNEQNSLALDDAGYPHIAYWNWEGELQYAWRDGENWQIGTIDNQGNGASAISLALNGFGHPCVGYVADELNELRYAWYDGTDWYTETINSVGQVGRDASLALDKSGRPHITYSYRDRLNDDLMYVWYDGSFWYTEKVDEASRVGDFSSLALDGGGRPHISYSEHEIPFWDYFLKYAWHDGAAWHKEVVSDSGEMEAAVHLSLALDEFDRPHISYCNDGNFPGADDDDSIKYAWRDGTSWHIETVDSSRFWGGETSLKLDRLNQPHIGYIDGELYQKYAWRDGANWHIETLDIHGLSDTSLVLDGEDHAHLSYASGITMPGLKYAWHDGTTWYTETVDNSGYGSRSLALDQLGYPHIGYLASPETYDPASNDLKYAWYDGVTWHIEKLDRVFNEGQDLNVSLALDKSDRPRILYDDSSALKYAWHDGEVWHVEVVAPNGRAGGQSSLILDETGRPHISYLDTINYDLKYALLMPSLDQQATPREGLRNGDTLTCTLTIAGPALDLWLWDPLPDSVRYITDSLTSTVTPTAIYSSTAHAVTWRGALYTDTVQTIRFQVTPGITGTEPLSLAMPIVNTAWLTDKESGWSVSTTSIVNGRHYYLPLILW
jgi:hypothetical protein